MREDGGGGVVLANCVFFPRASAGTRDEGVESVSERRRGAPAVRYGGDALAPTDQLIF